MSSIKLLCIILMFSFSYKNSLAQTRTQPKLFPNYNADTKLYGYVDSNGQLVIPHKYADAKSFSEGLAAVRMNGKYPNNAWGFITEKDSVVIPFKYYGEEFGAPSLFRNGLSEVILNGVHYLINKNQDFFDNDQYFQYFNGLAKIRKSFGEIAQFGFVNKKGELKIPIKFKGAADFSEGLAAVFIDSAWGYIDTLGRTAISPRFNSAESFSYGRAVVGVIRKAQNPTVPKDNQDDVDFCKWNSEPAWSGSSYEYRNYNENCSRCADCFIGIIDKKGDFIIKPKYKFGWIMAPGLYKVGKGDCTYELGEECYRGIVNDKDEDVLKCNFKFSDILNLTSNKQYFLVEKGNSDYNLKSIIDKDCNTLIPFKYYQLFFGPLIDDKNPITVGIGTLPHGEGEMKLRYVFMNINQRQVIQSSFEDASAFEGGVAEVSSNGKQYCIKSDGVLLEYCDSCKCYR